MLQLLTGTPTVRMPKDSDNSRPKRVAARPGTIQNSACLLVCVWGTLTFSVQLPTRSRACVARYGKTCLLQGVTETTPPPQTEIEKLHLISGCSLPLSQPLYQWAYLQLRVEQCWGTQNCQQQ